VVSNIAPRQVTSLAKAALAGDLEKAKEIHYKLLPAFKAAFVETNPVPIKAAMNMFGLPAGTLRLPLCPLLKENEPRLKAAFIEAGIFAAPGKDADTFC
jgi:4-hydroxy-tetrahydrodipicolinate synthase